MFAHLCLHLESLSMFSRQYHQRQKNKKPQFVSFGCLLMSGVPTPAKNTEPIEEVKKTPLEWVEDMFAHHLSHFQSFLEGPSIVLLWLLGIGVTWDK